MGQHTGETQAQLDARKVAKGWGAWLFNAARLPAPVTPVLPQGGAAAPAAAAPAAAVTAAAPAAPAAAAEAAGRGQGRLTAAFVAAKTASPPPKVAGKKRAAEASPPVAQKRTKAARA